MFFFMKEFFSQKDARDSGKFMLGIGLAFAVLYLFFSLFPLEWFEYFYAAGTLFFLKILLLAQLLAKENLLILKIIIENIFNIFGPAAKGGLEKWVQNEIAAA